VIVQETSPVNVKKTIRQRIRDARLLRSRNEAQTEAMDLAAVVMQIPQVRSARRVAAYASMSHEPDTRLLIRALHAAGKTVILPIVLPDGALEWAEYAGVLVAAQRFGGPEPPGPRLGTTAIADVDVIIVPALAVDTLGRRLGQGGGYYDRALPIAGPHTPVIALVHDGEIFDAAVDPIPAEPHDCVVDGIVTSRRYLPLHPAVGLTSWLAPPTVVSLA
jgi:5-formyltetrahydrofolate cyclo-ligase